MNLKAITNIGIAMNVKAIATAMTVKPITLSNETQVSDKFGFLGLTECGKYLVYTILNSLGDFDLTFTGQ